MLYCAVKGEAIGIRGSAYKWSMTHELEYWTFRPPLRVSILVSANPGHGGLSLNMWPLLYQGRIRPDVTLPLFAYYYFVFLVFLLRLSV